MTASDSGIEKIIRHYNSLDIQKYITEIFIKPVFFRGFANSSKVLLCGNSKCRYRGNEGRGVTVKYENIVYREKAVSNRHGYMGNINAFNLLPDPMEYQIPRNVLLPVIRVYSKKDKLLLEITNPSREQIMKFHPSNETKLCNCIGKITDDALKNRYDENRTVVRLSGNQELFSPVGEPALLRDEYGKKINYQGRNHSEIQSMVGYQRTGKVNLRGGEFDPVIPEGESVVVREVEQTNDSTYTATIRDTAFVKGVVRVSLDIGDKYMTIKSDITDSNRFKDFSGVVEKYFSRPIGTGTDRAPFDATLEFDHKFIGKTSIPIISQDPVIEGDTIKLKTPAKLIFNKSPDIQVIGPRYHGGWDIYLPEEDYDKVQIYALADSYVAKAQASDVGDFGRSVSLEFTYKDTLYSILYAHLGSIRVKQGDCVRGGQIVGFGGVTGNAKGGPPHVHIQLSSLTKTNTDIYQNVFGNYENYKPSPELKEEFKKNNVPK